MDSYEVSHLLLSTTLVGPTLFEVCYLIIRFLQGTMNCLQDSVSKYHCDVPTYSLLYGGFGELIQAAFEKCQLKVEGITLSSSDIDDLNEANRMWHSIVFS